MVGVEVSQVSQVCTRCFEAICDSRHIMEEVGCFPLECSCVSVSVTGVTGI